MILEEEFLFFHNNHLDEDVLLFSRIEMDRDLGSFKRARSAGEGSWTAGGWTRQRVLGGVIVDARHHHRHHNHHHRADLYKRNDVSSREGVGRERRQSGALEKRLSAVKNAGELLVCLARYKRPGAALSGRSTPPLPGHRYFGAIRAVKKKKGGKKTTPFREKTRPSTVLLLFFFFFFLLFWPSLSTIWTEFCLGGWILRIESFERHFYFFFFRKKYGWLFWRMFFTNGHRDGMFQLSRIFRWIIVADLKMKYFSGLLFLANGYE